MAKKWNDTRLAELRELKEQGFTFRQIAEQMDSTYDAVRNQWRRNLKTNDEVVREAGLDPNYFKSKTINVNGSWFSRTEEALDIETLVSEIRNEIEKEPIDTDNSECYHTANPDMIIPLFDLHIGFERSEELYKRLQNLPKQTVANTAHVLLGGDLLHYEGQGTTASGTKIENNPNVTEMVTEGTTFLIKLRKLLREKFAYNVQFHMVAGNHANYMENAMLATMSALGYMEEQDFTATSQGFLIGNTPIAMYHGGGINGSKIKQARYFDYLYTQHPELVKHALETGNNVVMYTGHLHFQQFNNEHNVLVKQVPVVWKSSDYEIKNGFLGAENMGMIDYYITTGISHTVYY
ncbi:hypothetical protein pwc_27 [Weissella phage PWc]|nr:hypothetical protein pwc_27 [Weissella phage PWc]